jgi:hypothetical protein
VGTKIILPRKSVFKAIVGVVIIFGTVALTAFDTFGYRSFGVLDLIPIGIGAMLINEYFREP